MITKQSVVKTLISNKYAPKTQGSGKAFTNIALIKYWGKRCNELHLPVTSSLSITLPLSTMTSIVRSDKDRLFLNGVACAETDAFFVRTRAFFDLFRPNSAFFFEMHTTNEIPTAAGLASSASGYAALVFALNDLFCWNLPFQELSILARLGSGSACRSVYNGFVQWQRGVRATGEDSFAIKLPFVWDALRVGILLISDRKKHIDSRQGMQRTVETSALWKAWPALVEDHLQKMHEALIAKNFTQFGEIAEQNALAMHATALAAREPVLYWLPESVQAMYAVWEARRKGIEVYFTMDAGPNLKLLYLEQEAERIREVFPSIQEYTPVLA